MIIGVDEYGDKPPFYVCRMKGAKSLIRRALSAVLKDMEVQDAGP